MTSAVTRIGRVMLIDDEDIDRRLYARVLKRSGLIEDLIDFGGGADAMAHLADPSSRPVDLILLDINMPGMNGFEFLDGLARLQVTSRLDLPVAIMLTTTLNPHDMKRLGAFDSICAYLNKPFDGEQVAGLATTLAARNAA